MRVTFLIAIKQLCFGNRTSNNTCFREEIVYLYSQFVTQLRKKNYLYCSSNPRSLHRIDKTALGIWYYYNKFAWMQRSIFESYFKNMFHLKNRKIILLADNVSSQKSIILNYPMTISIFYPKYVDPTSTTRPRNYL